MATDVNIDTILTTINIILETPITKEQLETEFTALDIDSITFISIVVELEKAFDVEFPDEYLLITKLNTIRQIQKVLIELVRCP